MKDELTLVCEKCGQSFSSTRNWARFCSDSCRNAFHNEKKAQTDAPKGPKCIYCGNDDPRLQEKVSASSILCVVCAKEFKS